MWDKDRPQKLIKALPFNAFALQHVVDVDKYLGSERLGYDLCGNYATFCTFCSKWVKNPCITAYYIGERYKSVVPMLDGVETGEPALVQAITDVDKYLGSEGFGCDLCGRYAPFCAMCDKSLQNPCGEAYAKFKALGETGTSLAAQVGGELITVDFTPWSTVEEPEEQPEDRAPEDEAPVRRYRIGTARRRA